MFCGLLRPRSITLKNIANVERRIISVQSKGEWLGNLSSVLLWETWGIHYRIENCVNAISRIKLPKSFPFDPFQTLSPCPYWPNRRSLLYHLAAPVTIVVSSPASHLVLASIKANIPADNAKGSIVQISPYIRLAGEMKRHETSHAIRPSGGAPN